MCGPGMKVGVEMSLALGGLQAPLRLGLLSDCRGLRPETLNHLGMYTSSFKSFDFEFNTKPAAIQSSIYLDQASCGSSHVCDLLEVFMKCIRFCDHCYWETPPYLSSLPQ